MIKNTDLFYTRAKQYQDKRKDIMDEYETRLANLETAKGSAYYDLESKEAEDKQEAALKALKDEYGEYFNVSLAAMSKANASRKMTPPTEEELRTLQLLKMKEKPTEAELQAAANTLKGNETCLSILSEISRNAGYIHNYERYFETKRMTVEAAEKIIKDLYSSVRDFMDYDTPRTARLAREYQERTYGLPADAPALEKRPLFGSKAGCFYEIERLTGDELEAFENAVNGED